MFRRGKDPFNLSIFGTDGKQTTHSAVRAGSGGLHQFPGFGLVIKTVAGDGTHWAGIQALSAEFALNRTMEIRIDDGLDTPAREGKFSHALDLIAYSHTAAAEDAFVCVPLEKRGVVHRKGDRVPGILRIIDPIFIDQALKVTVSLFFATGAGHRMVEENKLELSFPGFGDFKRMGDNLHSIFGGGEAGRQKLSFPFLLNHTEPAGPKGDEPPVVTQGWDSDTSGLGGLKDGFPLFDLYQNTINGQFYCSIAHSRYLVKISNVKAQSSNKIQMSKCQNVFF